MSCYTIKSCLNPSGEKQLTLLVVHSTRCISNLIPKRLLKLVVKYFKIFGSNYYILRDRENLEKFDTKSD